MNPFITVSIVTLSKVIAKLVKSAFLSLLALAKSALVHANIVEIELEECS
jgi:hypothetical protein